MTILPDSMAPKFDGEEEVTEGLQASKGENPLQAMWRHVRSKLQRCYVMLPACQIPWVIFQSQPKKDQ